MDTLIGIISLECVGHQEKIEFTMSQITTKKLFAWSKKSPFLALKVHILFSYDRRDKTVKFPFLSSPLSVGFCFIAASVVFPFCFSLMHHQRVSKLTTGVAVKAEQLTNIDIDIDKKTRWKRARTTAFTLNDWPFVLSFMKSDSFVSWKFYEKFA